MTEATPVTPNVELMQEILCAMLVSNRNLLSADCIKLILLASKFSGGQFTKLHLVLLLCCVSQLLGKTDERRGVVPYTEDMGAKAATLFSSDVLCLLCAFVGDDCMAMFNNFLKRQAAQAA